MSGKNLPVCLFLSNKGRSDRFNEVFRLVDNYHYWEMEILSLPGGKCKEHQTNEGAVG